MVFIDARREAGRTPLRASPRLDRRALVCCALTACLLAVALTIALSRSAEQRTGTNGVLVQANMVVPAGAMACQGRERLPAGSGELLIDGLSTAPPLVVVRRGDRVVTQVEGTVDRRAGRIRASIEPPGRALDDVQVCLDLQAPAVLGRGITPPGVGTVIAAGHPIPGDSLAISYRGTDHGSWWGFAATLAERIRGQLAEAGAWAPWAILGLLAASLALTGWIVARVLVRDRPPARLALAVAAVAVLNAAAWSLITPTFQVPDEAAHIAYVQALGETGRPPTRPPALTLSPEEAAAMADSGFGAVTAFTYRSAAWSRQSEGRLAADLARPLSRRQTVAAGEAEPEPPLYYALEAIPYRMAHGGTLLDRVLLMRMLSALLAGATALLSFQFVRECLPAKPWAWAVAGLGVALTPMLGFVSGGVNPDALLFALSAGLFLCVARAWRRGATIRLAVALGALIGAGMLTKVNFYALVPGALLGFALASRRTTLAWDRRVLRMVGAAALIGAGLFVAGAAFEALAWDRSVLAARPVAPESHVGLLSHLGYIWQVFLPRLPFEARTALEEPGYQQLFESFVGAFGHLIVRFPTWFYRLSVVVLALVGLLAVRVLRAEPRELRWRRGELLGYAAMTVALLLMIGLSADLRRHLIAIVQGRYLLPLLPLFGALLALAARGAGERWGRAVGVAVVSGAVAWSLYGQLLTIAWFYS